VTNLDTPIKLVVDSDDICTPCIHLLPNGQYGDMLHKFENPISKQEYNNFFDRKLLPWLNLEENSEITFLEFLKIVNKKTPDRGNLHPSKRR
jgi:hypothetical protein